MSTATILAVLVVVIAVPIHGFVSWRLGRLSGWAPTSWTLRERAVSALALQFIVSVFAAIFVNNEMPHPFLNGDATKLITRGAVLALVVPALYWLRASRQIHR